MNTIKLQTNPYSSISPLQTSNLKTDLLTFYFFQALVDGPTTGVPRQSISLGHVVLTPLSYSLPRGSRTSTVAKKFEAAGVESKWSSSSWAKKIAQRERRRALTDFERFQVLVLKKQKRYAVKKAVSKA